MNFYLFTIFSAASFIYIFISAFISPYHMPQKWENHCYSKSKFALVFNKIFKWFDRPLDYFFEPAIYAHLAIFLVSIVVLIIDIRLNNFISNYLGSTGVGILCAVITGMPLFYTRCFLVVLYHMCDSLDFEE